MFRLASPVWGYSPVKCDDIFNFQHWNFCLHNKTDWVGSNDFYWRAFSKWLPNANKEQGSLIEMSYPFVFIPAAGYGASCWFGAVKSSHFLLCQTKVICLAVAPCRILQGCHFCGWKSWWLDADVWCGLLIFGGMVHESASSWHSSQANRPWDWTHSNISPGKLVMEFWDTRRFAMHNPQASLHASQRLEQHCPPISSIFQPAYLHHPSSFTVLVLTQLMYPDPNLWPLCHPMVLSPIWVLTSEVPRKDLGKGFFGAKHRQSWGWYAPWSGGPRFPFFSQG